MESGTRRRGGFGCELELDAAMVAAGRLGCASRELCVGKKNKGEGKEEWDALARQGRPGSSGSGRGVRPDAAVAERRGSSAASLSGTLMVGCRAGGRRSKGGRACSSGVVMELSRAAATRQRSSSGGRQQQPGRGARPAEERQLPRARGPGAPRGGAPAVVDCAGLGMNPIVTEEEEASNQVC